MASLFETTTGRVLQVVGKFAMSSVEGLVAALAGKAPTSHTHTITALPVASQADAEGGGDTTKVVNSLRLRQGANEAIRIFAEVQVQLGMTDVASYTVAAGKRVYWAETASGVPVLVLPDPSLRTGQRMVVHSSKGSLGPMQVELHLEGDAGGVVEMDKGWTLDVHSDGSTWTVVAFYPRLDGRVEGVDHDGVLEKLINNSTNQNLSDNTVTTVLTGSTERTLTVLDDDKDGRRIHVKNAATAFYNLFGKLEGTSNVTVGLPPGEAVTLQWSAVSGCWRIIGGYSPRTPRYSVLAADVVNNNASANTLADLTGLGFLVQPGIYRFRFLIPYNAAATTTGSRWTINGPTLVSAAYRSLYALTATTETVNQGLTGYQQPAAANATSLTTGNVAIIEGIVEVSATGTLVPQFASEVSSSAITALKGATGELVRVG